MRSSLLMLCVAALAGNLASAQSTLNVSQDLVRLGIAAANMIPGRPGLDSSPLLAAAIAYAKSGRASRIIADRGAYYLLSRQNPVSYLVISDTNNLIIDLQGSDLYFADPWVVGGFLLVANTNLTLQNFTLDFLKLPFTQLKVTAVSGSQIQYTVQPGYQDPAVFNGVSNNVYALIFRNGQRAGGLNHLTRLPVQLPISGDRLTIQTNCCVFTPAVLQQIRPGDIAAVFAFSGSALAGTNCFGCVFRSITVYSGFGPGLFSPESSVFERIYTLPRPGTDRLLS